MNFPIDNKFENRSRLVVMCWFAAKQKMIKQKMTKQKIIEKCYFRLPKDISVHKD